MFKYLAAFLALLIVCSAASAQQSQDGDQKQRSGEVVFFVFDENQPLSGAEVLADGQVKGETGPDGGLATSLPAGRHTVVLRKDGEQVLNLELLTAEGDQIRVIATLREGKEPELNIESSGTGPVLAQDAEGGDAGPKPGLLEGTITAEGGQPVADARVRVPSRGRAVRTDENGLFRIELPPGNYQLKVTHPDYASATADNLRVIPGKAVTADLALSTAGVQLADYTVTADYEEGSIASEINLQRESPQVTSVIGAEQIARTGDSDAAEALQRVSGLLIERGKFVVIRGQPFRYSLTTFNGMPLASPDPIIQAVPLDLFPESILANIQVQKSYSVDKPGNFGAGLVGLDTRGVPDEPFFELQVSTGGNTFSTAETGLTYEGSNEDALGQDGGERELPDEVPSQEALDDLSTSERQAVGRSFDDFYLVETEELPADIGVEAAGGRSFPTQYGTFGVIATASYDQEYRRERELDRTFTTQSLEQARVSFEENRTDRNVQLSSLLGFSAEWDNHSVRNNNFFIRDSQDRTQISEGFDRTSGDREERRFLLEFQRRELLLHQLVGEHEFDFGQLDWRVQTADTERDRPDRSQYRYQRSFGTSGQLTFFDDLGLRRSFNNVDEGVDSAAVDWTFPLTNASGLTTKFIAGGDVTMRDRESETRRFQFQPRGDADLTDPVIEQIINDNTIDDDASEIQFRERTIGTDTYNADTRTDGVYIGGDISYTDLLDVVFGLRRTKADFDIETDDGTTGGFDEEFTLSAISVTGHVTEDMQVRAAANETVSYPRLVELSNTTFFNPDTGEQFQGNPALQPTQITSYDLRWEWYPSAVEAVKAGVFYKELSNTIEEQFLTVAGGGSRTTFVNGEMADIIGLEVGGRLSLDRLVDAGVVPWNWVGQTYVQANASISESEVDIGQFGGSATNRKRALTGQAESTLNLQLGYDGPTHDLTLVANRVGERLYRAGIQGRPDVFQQPSTFIDFTYSLTIPEALPLIGKVPFVGQGQLKLKGRNLLDEESEFRQGSRLQRRIIFGRSYSASLKWNFF